MEPLPIRCCNLSLFQLQSCATEAFIGYGFAAQARQLKGSVVSNEGACGRQRNKKPWFKNDARMLEPVPNVYFKQLVLFQWMKTAEHWKRSLKFTNSLNLPDIIYLYIYVLYIYILYSISPFSFLRLFLFFLPFIVSFIKSWWFIPQLSRLWGANLTTSTLTAQGTMTIDQVDVQNLARSVDRWQLPKLLGLHWQLVLSGERGVPTPSLHKRVQKAADSWWAAFWCWWFFWKKIWRAAKETLIGLDMESYGNVRILFP